MKRLILSALLLVATAHASDECHGYYQNDAETSFAHSLTKNLDDMTELCLSGINACGVRLQSAAVKAGAVTEFTAKVSKRAMSKSKTDLIKTAIFGLDQASIKELILNPLTKAVNQGKQAELQMIRIRNGHEIQSPQPSHLERFLGKKPAKITAESLQNDVLNSEIEIWAHSIYSASLISVSLAKNIAQGPMGMMMSLARGGKTEVLANAKTIILARFKDAFEENKHLPMDERLKASIRSSFEFEGREDLMDARNLIFEQYGFAQLMTALNRDPQSEYASSLQHQ